MNEPIDVFNHIDMRGKDECWQWNGTWGGAQRERRPYFMAAGRRQIAYRWVYELVHGVTLEPKQSLLHSCDNGGDPIGCCNPAHLRLGSTQENMDDMKRRERHGLPHNVVKAIRRLLAESRTQEEIATLYGVSRETISAIATRRVYSHVQGDGDEP
jgi:hypothetical protein